MSRKLLDFCVAVNVVSSLLLLSTRFIEPAPTFLLFLFKLGLLIGAGGTLAIWASRRIFGQTRTDHVMKNLMLTGAALAISLILAESVVRFALRNITTTKDNSSYFARRWERNHVRLNKWGFREREFTLDKPQKSYRIAVIGDSFTFGQGIPEKDRFTNVMEEQLGRVQNGYRYEVLNFGKPGTDLVDHRKLLEDVVLPANPDFILLQWYVNDFEGHDGERRPERLSLLPSSTLQSALHQWSGLYFLLEAQWKTMQDQMGLSRSYVEYMKDRFGDPGKADMQAAVRLLKDFIGASRKMGKPVGMVLFPHMVLDLRNGYPFEYLHNRVLSICDEERIICKDLRETFVGVAYDQLRVNRFDGHPSELANQVAAEEIMRTFKQTWIARSSNFSRASYVRP